MASFSLPAGEICFTVRPDKAGQRLDVFLAQAQTSVSRSQLKRAVEEGQIFVNEKMPKAGQQLNAGDVVRLLLKPPVEAAAVAQNIPLKIVYEDEAIIVIDKPAGMVVHPAPGNPDNTLVNALLFHCRDLSGIGGVYRPGIVHRLDKDTSGLIVAAKSDDAHRQLTAQFEKQDVHKTYRALVWGDVLGNSGEIILPVGRHPSDRKKMSTKSKKGRSALTLWKVRERFGAATLLDVEIKTGRTHQIRVHLSARGYPVIGDAVYGISSKMRCIKDADLKARLKSFSRQALHAAALSFLHPLSRERMVFTSDMSAEITDLCAAFRALAISSDKDVAWRGRGQRS